MVINSLIFQRRKIFDKKKIVHETLPLLILVINEERSCKDINVRGALCLCEFS